MSRPLVLLVDDEPNVTSALKRQLHSEPYEIVEASSARAALEILAQRDVHVVVSDEMMPGLSGSELIAQIRHEYPAVIRIILSGQASLDAVLRAINQGEVYRFLTKPCNSVDLASTIRNALDYHAVLAENRSLRHTVAEQRRVLADLDERYPGISTVERDADDAVLIDADDAFDLSQM